VLKLGVLLLCVFGIFVWAQMNNEAQPKLTFELRIGEEAKQDVMLLLDDLAEKYSLTKEYLDSPSRLENRPVRFFHYKQKGQVVLTVHDLKGGGDRLTLYFYGLPRVDEKAFENDLQESLSGYENLGGDSPQ
jgi:hypothetical protein